MYQISTIPEGWYEKNRLVDVILDTHIAARRIQKESGIIQYVMIIDKEEYPITKELFLGFLACSMNCKDYCQTEWEQYKYFGKDGSTYDILDKIPPIKF